MARSPSSDSPLDLFPRPLAKDRKAGRRTPTRDAALYDFLVRRRAALHRPPPLAQARARVDQLHGTTDIVALRDAAIDEAIAALEIAEHLPPLPLLDEDDLT